jgi:zinc resistance-associated protein
LCLVATIALLSFSVLAFAAPKQGSRHNAMRELSTEQMQAIEGIAAAHQEKLYDLREQIWAKHTELQALTASGKAERSDIQGLIKDISALRGTLHRERVAIRNEVEKQTGITQMDRHEDETGPGAGYHGKSFEHGMIGY